VCICWFAYYLYIHYIYLEIISLQTIVLLLTFIPSSTSSKHALDHIFYYSLVSPFRQAPYTTSPRRVLQNLFVVPHPAILSVRSLQFSLSIYSNTASVSSSSVIFSFHLRSRCAQTAHRLINLTSAAVILVSQFFLRSMPRISMPV